MTVHEGLQCAAINKLNKHGPGKAQNHHKRMDSPFVTLRLLNLKISPVHLALKPGLGFKPDVGQVTLTLFDLVHILLERIVAAFVAHVPYAIKDPRGLIAILFEKVVNDPFERIQNGRPPFAFPILRYTPGFQVLLDCVAVNSQLLGYIAQAEPLTA